MLSDFARRTGSILGLSSCALVLIIVPIGCYNIWRHNRRHAAQFAQLGPEDIKALPRGPVDDRDCRFRCAAGRLKPGRADVCA